MTLSFTPRPSLVELEVVGVPAPQGSKTVGRSRDGHSFVREANRELAPWRATLAAAARDAMNDREPLTGPLLLEAKFCFPRPQSHYRSGRHAGELAPRAPKWHSTRPDLDKLLRALGDALTGIVWRDDAQLAQVEAAKTYGSPGLLLVVYPL